MSYEHSYFLIVVLMIGALCFAAAPVIISSWLRPKKPSPSKQDTYECGLASTGDSWGQFKVQYYIFALIFVIFDLETIFLLPWAVAFNRLGAFAFVEMMVFLCVLLGGLVWAWGKGVLEWK
jgi:NADH-quinone oxidoreductase subunit A